MARVPAAAMGAAWLAAAAAAAVIAAVYAACSDQNLLPNPGDPAARGPWAVGLRTVVITERNMTVDVLYPALPGSEVGRQVVVYDIREHIPERQAAKIPDEDAPLQEVEAYRDLPLDTTHGPYPVHIHVHGTAAWRSASAHQLTHMASRGFVVLAADHPGITLYDLMRLGNGQEIDQEGDARRMIAELETLADPQLQFLNNSFTIERLAVSGHSAGGGAAANLGDKAQVLMPWASFGANEGPAVKSILIMGGEVDSIAAYRNQVTGYERAPAPKRLVGIANAGHLWCTDLCWIGEEDGGLVQIALDHGIYIAVFFRTLGTDGCNATNVKNFEAWTITNYAVSAAQEAVLQCDDTMNDRLAEIATSLDNIYEYREELAV